MKLRHLLVEMLTDNEVRCAAWLYMLEYPYHGEMKINSWKGDKRMGVEFLVAMNILKISKLVEIGSESVKSKSSAKKYLYKVFGEPKDEEDAYEMGDKFKKYNTSSFTISSIPVDMFDRDYQKNVDTKKSVGIPGMGSKYSNLISWIKKFQRDSNLNFKSEFKQFSKDERLMDLDKNYILFRGLFINKNNEHFETFNKLKVGQTIDNKNISWSWSKSSAMKFAKGSTNWMDQPKWKSGESIAIILQHQFDQSEILCDLYYMDLLGYSFIDFPDEKEVVVFPKNRKCKIIEILK